MDLERNEEMMRKLNGLRFEVLDSGYAKVTVKEWRRKEVCSPFSRLYYIIEGAGEVQASGRSTVLRPGYSYLIPAGMTYDYECRSAMTQVFFHINLTRPDGLDLLRGCLACCERKPAPGTMERICTYYQQDSYEKSLLLKGFLLEEIAGFLPHMMNDDRAPGQTTPLVQQVYYLAQNPVWAGHTVKSIAAKLHVSESTVSRRFKNEMGMTLGSYLDKVLCQSACRMLLSTSLPISQISEELGFSDPFYFSRYFKRMLAETPSAYRKRLRSLP